jgi:membrane protein YdbS with pleckstrin-like domain
MSEPQSDLERSIDPQAGADKVPPMDDQVVYYEGSPRLRGELSTLALWTIIGLVFAAGPFLLMWGGAELAWYVYAIGILIGIICWTIPSLVVRRNYYKITNYRIDYEHGIVFKKMDTLELWHVEDVSLTQGPLDRIFNVGTIMVISSDQTTPQLALRSISSPRKLLETLKTRIIAVKRQRGVVKLDMG